jgi:hypothetical protein
MLKDYVLGSEIAKIGGFNIANISMTIKCCGLVEGRDYQKFGGMTLLNKKCLFLPNNINNIIKSGKTTDLSDLIPHSFFIDTINNLTTLIKDKYQIKNVQGKKFVKIKDKKLFDIIVNDNLTKYVVETYEIPELVNKNYIQGHIKLSNKKELVWY